MKLGCNTLVMLVSSVLLVSKTWEIRARLLWPICVVILCHRVEHAISPFAVEVAALSKSLTVTFVGMPHVVLTLVQRSSGARSAITRIAQHAILFTRAMLAPSASVNIAMVRVTLSTFVPVVVAARHYVTNVMVSRTMAP
jgi:hypothetical protein